ncbi:MAG: LacI family DNA-binding transcriptional regulator, partial [Treponema sp.]|nr:LacI family DNA-binding transcriptional regulator [Treponema sp.]
MKSLLKSQITQNDVARRAGVSRSMISYALNDYGRAVAPETRQKILNAIVELDNRPNKYTQSLSTGARRSLADRHSAVQRGNVSAPLLHGDSRGDSFGGSRAGLSHTLHPLFQRVERPDPLQPVDSRRGYLR